MGEFIGVPLLLPFTKKEVLEGEADVVGVSVDSCGCPLAGTTKRWCIGAELVGFSAIRAIVCSDGFGLDGNKSSARFNEGDLDEVGDFAGIPVADPFFTEIEVIEGDIEVVGICVDSGTRRDGVLDVLLELAEGTLFSTSCFPDDINALPLGNSVVGIFDIVGDGVSNLVTFSVCTAVLPSKL